MSADTGGRSEEEGATLERGLFVVMQTDVANFSGNITQREEWVARRLHADLAKFSELVAAFEGRVVADRGDGLKVLFRDPVRALQAAIAMQEYVFQANLNPGAKENPLKHRIGLDVGDLLIQDAKVDGAAVSIAARLETRCEPGKICFTDEFHQLTKSQVKIYRSFKGSESLKGVSRMVRVWMASISVDLSDEVAGAGSAVREFNAWSVGRSMPSQVFPHIGAGRLVTVVKNVMLMIAVILAVLFIGYLNNQRDQESLVKPNPGEVSGSGSKGTVNNTNEPILKAK